MIHYDTIYYVRPKLTGSQLGLPHETKKSNNKTKQKQKKQDAEKKRSSRKAVGVFRVTAVAFE